MVKNLGLDEGLLMKAVDLALSEGAHYAEARYQKDIMDNVVLRNEKVIGGGTEIKEGVGIRVLVEGSLGFAATNDLTSEGLKAAVTAAIARAKGMSRLRRVPIEFTDERVGKASYEVKTRKSLKDLTMEYRISLGKEVVKEVKGSVKSVTVPVIMYEMGTHLQEKLIITSDGAYIHSIVPRVNLMANVVLASQEKGTLQRMFEFAASGGAELVDEWRVTEKITQEVERLENILLKGVQPPSEEVDVVVGPEVVGLLVHESSGHPMEADRILGREAAQAGESFVKPDMIGNYRIGSELATVVEDPTIPGSNGFYLYDDEGVPARPRYLYKEGLIYEPLHNRHTAKIFGTNSNAAARSMDYRSEPIVRMSNTYFKPGDMTFNELIEDIRLGVYIKSYMEWNIDDQRWNQRYVGLESYMIRDGELAEPVKNPVLEITTKGFYSRVVGVDRNLEFFPGTCGKGEPAQGVPVWFGGPNVRLSKIKLGVIQ
ncbi:MAG: TldD/PmbA family protein [Thermoprotei archaeon]|nr:MAG: TldD/PmbA family protein [Thermoprotei archaeon]